ncbi:M4 family metallopeptidase [Candidatus Microgenomates bacterium]|nr:M4 family metallopeptidase [Candidatus Microgenomates bacterium]
MRKPLLSLLFFGVLAIGISFYILRDIYRSAAAADTTVTISADALRGDSAVSTKSGQTRFSLNSRNGGLYKTKQPGTAGVYEFLSKNIRFNKESAVSLSDLPQSLTPVKTLSDQEDPILQKAGKAGNRKHFYFNQKVGGLTVFGSQLAVHVKDDNEVYAMTGSLVQDTTLQGEHVDEARAQAIAITKVRGPRGGRVVVSKKEKVAVNPRLMGISDDQKTYPVLIVTTNQMVGGLDDPRRTMVSLTDGAVLSSIELADYALDRRVYDCAQDPSGSCSLKRVEGSPASGVADADSMFGFLGDIYTFYSGKMQRDSYDNHGGQVKAFVNLPAEINGEKLCPNARWLHKDTTTENQLQVCPGWVTKDVVAHEMTHGVVEYTANLDFLNQSGALNEAIADTFASGVDDDWQIGEDLPIGAIRYIDDPSKNKSPTSTGGTTANPMPDRLFATQYYCGTSDRGGVHKNMSVPTKGFYLAVVGGTFNGCTMTGIGKDKALLIWYQALTKYLNVNSNFRDAYNAINQGCSDLYGATSTECVNVMKSLQAVELDQQPLSDQAAPKCNNIAAAPATCIAQVVSPTATSIPPTNVPPSNTPEVSVTGWSCSGLQGDANHDGKISLADYSVWRTAFINKQ